MAQVIFDERDIDFFVHEMIQAQALSELNNN